MTLLDALVQSARDQLEHEIEQKQDIELCPFCGCPAFAHYIKRLSIARNNIKVAMVQCRCMECAYRKDTHQVVCFAHPQVVWNRF